MKNRTVHIYIIGRFGICIALTSCSDYLDKCPDDQ